MRDLAIAAVILVSFVYSLKKPYVGFLAWTWLSLMNPHRLAYGWIQSAPVAQITIIGVFAGFFFEKDKGKLFQHGIPVVQLFFSAWMAISATFAMFPEIGFESFTRAEKIQLAVFLSYFLVNSKEKLNGLLWVMFLSVGYYGIKGGIFTITTGGGGRVWGPAGTFIGDNNALACALLMDLPIGLYLMSVARHTLVKRGLVTATGLIGISILGSASRGAFLGLIAVCLYWMKNVPGKQKLLALFISLFLGLVALLVMPQSWWDRMHTVKTYDQDASAMGRINAWWCAYNLAKDRLTGGGFDYYTPTAFALYAPNPTDVHAAHSIYFQVLGDHGFIGLGLYLWIAIWTWLLLGKIIRNTQGYADLAWANSLARLIQLSLIGYFSAGAFLSLSYYDYYWQLVAITVILSTLLAKVPGKPLSDGQSQAGATAMGVEGKTFVRPCK